MELVDEIAREGEHESDDLAFALREVFDRVFIGAPKWVVRITDRSKTVLLIFCRQSRP